MAKEQAVEVADVKLAETVVVAPPPPPPEPHSELISLLNAVKAQTVALQVEQARNASDSRREIETLTTRMTTLAPLFVKAVEAQGETEKTANRLARNEIELMRKLVEAQGLVDRYRPLALQYEDELLTERNRAAQAARDFADLEAKHAKGQRTIEELFQKVAATETEMQRTAEANAAYAIKTHENEFALEAATREVAQLKSELVASNGEVARQAAELADRAQRLAAERDANSRAQNALVSLQADYEQLKRSSDSAAKDFEIRERRVHETIAQRDWQIYDYETRHAAQQSKIEFLSKKNESQREDILRHLAHIGRLESSNRHLLDTLSRNAISIDDTAENAERGKVTAPKLRAVKDE